MQKFVLIFFLVFNIANIFFLVFLLKEFILRFFCYGARAHICTCSVNLLFIIVYFNCGFSFLDFFFSIINLYH